MPANYFYWTLMLIWLVYGLWLGWTEPAAGRARLLGGNILLFLLFLLVGLKLFGAPIQ